jgi:predicted ester cyclase
MLSDTGKTAPELLLDAFTLHDPSLIDDAVASDYTEHSAPPGMPPGKQALKAFVQMFTTALPDFHFDTELRTEQDGLVMVYGYAEGTLHGPLFGSPATGRHGRWPEVHIFRVADGLITDHWDVIDQLSMRTQLGLPLSFG